MTKYEVLDADWALDRAFQNTPYCANIIRSFADFTQLHAVKIYAFTIHHGDNIPGCPSIGFTKNNRIHLVVGRQSGYDTSNDIDMARFVMAHEVIHNVYAPENVVCLLTMMRIIQNADDVRDLFDNHPLKTELRSACANFSQQQFLDAFRAVGDILVNAHICEDPIPQWGRTAGELCLHGVSRTAPTLPDFYAWNNYYANGRTNPPSRPGHRFRELMDKWVTEKRPAKEWRMDAYAEFIIMNHLWSQSGAR